MTAVLLRLCDEDRAKYAKPGWPEWIRFDETALDDQDLVTLNQWESELNVSLEFLLLVDKPSRTVRWKAACAWMGLQLAGHKPGPLEKFNVKPRKIEVKDEPEPKTRKTKAADDAAPLPSSPSSEDAASETASA